MPEPQRAPCITCTGVSPTRGTTAQPYKWPRVGCGSGSVPQTPLVSPPQGRRGWGSRDGVGQGAAALRGPLGGRDPAPTRRTPKLPGRVGVTRHHRRPTGAASGGGGGLSSVAPRPTGLCCLGTPTRDPQDAGWGGPACPPGTPEPFPGTPPKRGLDASPPIDGAAGETVSTGDHRGLPTATGHSQDPPPRDSPPENTPPPYPTGGRVGGPDPPTRFPRGAPRLSRARGPHRLPGRSGGGGGGQTPLPPWRPSVAGPGRDDPPPVCGGSSPALQAPWRAALTRVVHHAGLAALRERPPCGETRTVKPTGTGTGTGTGSSTGTGMGQAGRDGRREERRGREEGGHAAAHRRRGRWSPHARPCRCRCRCRSRTRSARSPREEGPRVRSLGRRAAIEPARPPPRRAPPPSPGRRHLPRSSPASSLLPARPRAAILARRGCWGNAEHTPRPAVREPPPPFLRHL